MESAIEHAQFFGIPEGRSHPASDDNRPSVKKWREAIKRQLLTPAPDANSVKGKQANLASELKDYYSLDVKPGRIERAIAEDLAFLASHPTRRSNSEAMARRREFNDAMRLRIREIAKLRDLSDDQIRPALTVKHHEIAKFTEKHGVNVLWLLEGEEPIFKS